MSRSGQPDQHGSSGCLTEPLGGQRPQSSVHPPLFLSLHRLEGWAGTGGDGLHKRGTDREPETLPAGRLGETPKLALGACCWGLAPKPNPERLNR